MDGLLRIFNRHILRGSIRPFFEARNVFIQDGLDRLIDQLSDVVFPFENRLMYIVAEHTLLSWNTDRHSGANNVTGNGPRCIEDSGVHNNLTLCPRGLRWGSRRNGRLCFHDRRALRFYLRLRGTRALHHVLG